MLANQADNPPGDYRYLWSTGDTVSALRVVHPGQYSLKVSGANDCATTEVVTINKDCYIDIPNAFTPDGDGLNDYFFPRQLLSKSLNGFRMQIFNRWGQLIFETVKNNGRGWDGAFNGIAQPAGVYIYLIDVNIEGNRREQYRGNVTLVR
jgi:gliding motility-associated-like protein